MLDDKTDFFCVVELACIVQLFFEIGVHSGQVRVETVAVVFAQGKEQFGKRVLGFIHIDARPDVFMMHHAIPGALQVANDGIVDVDDQP